MIDVGNLPHIKASGNIQGIQDILSAIPVEANARKLLNDGTQEPVVDVGILKIASGLVIQELIFRVERSTRRQQFTDIGNAAPAVCG